MSEFLMRQLKDLLTNYKPPKQRKKKNQIVLSVPSATMRTRERFGVLVKWKPIMYQLGARVAKQLPKIVRCCAKRTIEQKVIGRKTTVLRRKNKCAIFSLNF